MYAWICIYTLCTWVPCLAAGSYPQKHLHMYMHVCNACKSSAIPNLYICTHVSIYAQEYSMYTCVIHIYIYVYTCVCFDVGESWYMKKYVNLHTNPTSKLQLLKLLWTLEFLHTNPKRYKPNTTRVGWSCMSHRALRGGETKGFYGNMAKITAHVLGPLQILYVSGQLQHIRKWRVQLITLSAHINVEEPQYTSGSWGELVLFQICMQMCMFSCVYTYMFPCMYTVVSFCVFTQGICMFVCVYTCICTFSYMQASCMYPGTCVFSCVCIQVYICFNIRDFVTQAYIYFKVYICVIYAYILLPRICTCVCMFSCRYMFAFFYCVCILVLAY